MKFSIVIATYNRAADLRETLSSLSRLSTCDQWELIVVDNNSTDATREVVERAIGTFPVDLRYMFEAQQGRSAALNAGIAAARGEIIVTTDDDVRVEVDWLDRASHALESLGCDYIGGRVLPVWSGTRPEWLSERGGRQWAVIALLDYGPEPIALGPRVPLGVNMAFRRRVFQKAGNWDTRVGRKAGTLLGQEVREWIVRARAAGLRGCYVPEMIVHHVIPRDRLNKRYFRRWFYWRGISRAILYQHAALDMEMPQETVLDFSKVPHVAGVPRYLYRKVLRTTILMIRAAMRRDAVAAFEQELWIWFFIGIVVQRWRDRGLRSARSAKTRLAAANDRVRA